jgi:nitroreductase
MEEGIYMEAVSVQTGAIAERRSIRKFTNEEISHGDLHEILVAGLLAPSSKNRQPWHFTVLQGIAKADFADTMERGLNLETKAAHPFLPKSRTFLNGAFTSLRILREAPVLILVTNERGDDPDFHQTLDTDDRIAELCNAQSIGAAVENMCLEAQSRGLGTLWLGDIFFAYPELNAWVDDHDGGHGMLVAGLCLGHAAETPKARPRKDFAESVTFLR